MLNPPTAYLERPLLDLPVVATPCTRLLVSGAIDLTVAAMDKLLNALGTDDRSIHVSTFRKGPPKDGECFTVAERFGVDTTGYERKDHQKAEDEAGYVHFDIEVFKEPCDDRLKEDIAGLAVMERFWQWASGMEVRVWARANVEYPAAKFRSLISLPLKLPGDLGAFDAIPSLVLAKYEGEGEARQTLYEVSIRDRDTERVLGVLMRAQLECQPGMLSELIAKATEIASFAVAPIASETR